MGEGRATVMVFVPVNKVGLRPSGWVSGVDRIGKRKRRRGAYGSIVGIGWR